MDALQYAFTTSGLQQPTRWVPAGVLNGQGVYQSAHQNTAPGAPGAQIPRSQQVGPLMVAQQAQQTQHHMVHQQAPTQPIQMMQNGHMFKAGMKTQLPSNVQLINGRIVASAGLQQGGNGIPMHNLAIQQLAAPAPVYSRLPPANVINSNGLQMARMVSASAGLGAVQAGPSQMMQPIQTVRVPQLGQGNMRAGELGGGQMLSLQQQQLQQHQVAQLLQQQVHQQNQAAQQQLQLQQIAQQQQLEQQHKAQQRKVFQQQLQQQQLAQQYQASINTAQARQQLLTLQAHMNTMQAVQAGSSANATNQIQRQANSGMVYGTATNAQGQLINVRVLNSAQVGTGQLMEMQQVQGMRHVVRGHITPQQQQQQNVAAANQLLLLQAHARQQQLVAAGTQQARPVMIQQQVAAGSQGQAQGQAQGQGPFMLVSKASACSSLDNVSPHSWPQNATRMDPACNWPSMQKPGSRQQSMQLQGGLVMGGAVPVAGSLNNLVQTNSQQAMQGVPVARQLLTGVTGVSGGSGVDLQAIVSSIGVELAKHGIPVASALEAGWLGVLGENDVALLQEAYTAEISRLARVGAAPSASVYSACSDTPHMSHSPAGSGSVSSAASIPPVNGAPAPVMRQQSRGDLSTFAPHTFFGHMGEDEDGLLGELEADADDDDMSSAALADAMTDSVVGSVKHNELSGSLLKDGLAAHWGVGGLSWWSGSNSVANISDPQPWSLTAQFGLKTEAQEMENSEGAAGHSDPNRSDSDPLGSHTELAARLANLDLGCGFF